MNDNIVIRNIEPTDCSEYLSLMKEFHNYSYNISFDDFNQQLQIFKDTKFCNILVLFSIKENKLIGAGSIFNLIKLHNNSVGQIEDVIITKNYRGLGYGKLLIDKLTEVGLNNFKCYKIILNCLEKNVEFYKKCNFAIAGYEMKLEN
jgi:glucosamine-phosphate N-acetyltransferase